MISMGRGSGYSFIMFNLQQFVIVLSRPARFMAKWGSGDFVREQSINCYWYQ